jgi:hypothetical protein
MLKQTGLPAHYSPHSFRATGITNFLENDGTLDAERIVGFGKKCGHPGRGCLYLRSHSHPHLWYRHLRRESLWRALRAASSCWIRRRFSGVRCVTAQLDA